MLFSSGKRTSDPTELFLGNEPIKYVKNVRSLGLIIDNQLTWDAHISNLVGEIYGVLSTLRTTQHLLSRRLKMHLVKTLIVSKILYCSSIYSGCSNESWQKLKICFNDCVRYIFQVPRNQSVSLLVKEVLGASLSQFLDYHSCIQVHKLISGNAPSYLIEKLRVPKLQRNNNLNLPLNYKSKQRQNAFFVRVIKLWNSLESSVKSERKLSIFKKKCLECLTKV
jgi:hypothetical protein